jgi:tetratricopeptide (TPR) repeat protein
MMRVLSYHGHGQPGDRHGKRRSAVAAAKIQYAIVMLHGKFLEIIRTEDPDCGDLDFNKCIRRLKAKKGLIPGTDGSTHKSVVKLLERARCIRNDYSHQNFDSDQFQHDIECLEKVAAHVGVHPNKLRILVRRLTSRSHHAQPVNLASESVENWEKLKADGNEFYKQAKWKEAMDCYTHAICLNSKAAALYSNRALCELQLGKWKLAKEDAEDAIELDPGQVKYYRTLSQALFSMSLLKDAIEVCTQGLALDGKDMVLQKRLRVSQALLLVDERAKIHPIAEDLKSPASLARFILQRTLNESDVPPHEVLHIALEEFWTSLVLYSKARN